MSREGLDGPVKPGWPGQSGWTGWTGLGVDSQTGWMLALRRPKGEFHGNTTPMIQFSLNSVQQLAGFWTGCVHAHWNTNS